MEKPPKNDTMKSLLHRDLKLLKKRFQRIFSPKDDHVATAAIEQCKSLKAMVCRRLLGEQNILPTIPVPASLNAKEIALEKRDSLQQSTILKSFMNCLFENTSIGILRIFLQGKVIISGRVLVLVQAKVK